MMIDSGLWAYSRYNIIHMSLCFMRSTRNLRLWDPVFKKFILLIIRHLVTVN